MMTDLAPLRRALISVSDKTGLTELGQALAARGVEILSTGGTAKALRDAGLEVRDVSDFTGFPEMMDGRVKTLHPVVHGGLLARRDLDSHRDAMVEHNIGPIDLLVVNLYPFEDTVAKGADFDTCIENIDIGGPAMIRSAAKNHAFVSVVTDVADYDVLLADMDANAGQTTLALRQRLAQTAYARTAAYDTAVSTWMAAAIGDETPRRRSFSGTYKQTMRYGETAIRVRPFTPMAQTAPVWRPPCSIRARNCPITTSTTPMPHSNWWRNSTLRMALPWRSSNMPTLVALHAVPRC